MNLKKILETALAENRIDLLNHECVKDFIAKHDGKKITPKYYDIVKAAHMELDHYCGMWHINVNNKSHLISHGEFFQADKFDDLDSWAYNGSKQRIEQLERFLSDPLLFQTLNDLFKKLDKQWKAFCVTAKMVENTEASSFHNPCYYEILRTIGIESKLMQAIKYDIKK